MPSKPDLDAADAARFRWLCSSTHARITIAAPGFGCTVVSASPTNLPRLRELVDQARARCLTTLEGQP